LRKEDEDVATYEEWGSIRAWREGWITYLPSWAAYLAAAMAAVLVLLTPVGARYAVAVIAVVGEVIASNFTYWGGPLIYAAHLFSVGYVRLIWPFLLEQFLKTPFLSRCHHPCDNRAACSIDIDIPHAHRAQFGIPVKQSTYLVLGV
jgi:hypothetical protein